ncbi:transcription factor bHLH68-like isoform X2 [Magnolia sinica]|uniref:transcription factor bHLH68-like isoform X2 n=1 Tax=Magnolia sinica TaxID=86752 RepID=UPI00265AF794|nr:transcription factor bHLH68-like isoform X2 [Magnolia sinica]
MEEEMENGSNRVYRGEWTSETSRWIKWSSDVAAQGKQISNYGPSSSDESTPFAENKQICVPPLQFPEFSGPSPVWGQDLLGMRSGLSYDHRLDWTVGVNMIKQENPSYDLDRHYFPANFPIFGRKIQEMPAVFPATAIVGEEEMSPSSSNKAPLTDHSNQLLFYSNITPFWKASLEMSGANQSSRGPCQERSSSGNVAHKDSSTDTKKSNGETAPKRPRSESMAPFTTFKVRKEKLGDRITALQQLVSPFGKTDTASVLFDAIEYIKLLHDQVTVLSTPYMRMSQERCEGRKEREGTELGLRSRGLCLVPISTTLHVAKDNTTDFWAPTFGGTYR